MSTFLCFGIARLVPVVQAVVVAVVSYAIAKKTGGEGIILTASGGFVFGMVIFGMRQLGIATGENSRRLFRATFVRPLVVTPLILATAWWVGLQTAAVPGYPGLFLSGGLSFLIGLPLMGYLGVSAEVRGELFGMLLRPLRRFRPSTT